MSSFRTWLINLMIAAGLVGTSIAVTDNDKQVIDTSKLDEQVTIPNPDPTPPPDTKP